MAELPLGAEFAGYRIEAVAGRGGMGVVYRASELRLGRPVALKLIAAELAEDAQFRTRFEGESRTAASIEHPNVIPIYEAGEVDGLLFLAMRYIGGPDLRTVLSREGALDPKRAARIIDQVAAALDAAHQSGLVHRDVKPRNVLIADVGGRDHVYLTDFGLTKHITSTSGVTKTGQWVGTVDYVAPEQIHGQRLDARADVYSLGCVLYECLTGRVPFERDTEVARIYAHLETPPPSVTAARPDVPGHFDAVVERAMAKRPEDRFPSAGDLGRATLAAAEGTAPSAGAERTVAAGEAAGPAETRAAAASRPTEPLAPPPTPAPTTPIGRPPGRRRRLVAGLAIVVLLGGAAAVAATGVLSGDNGTTSTVVDGSSQGQHRSPGGQTSPGGGAHGGGGSLPASSPDPVAALKRHFELLQQGRYDQAADDLAPSLLASLGGRSTWISGQEADPLQSFSLQASVVDQSADSATVGVSSLRTVASSSGCQAFSGTYGLVRSGSGWLIGSNDLSQAGC